MRIKELCAVVSATMEIEVNSLEARGIVYGGSAGGLFYDESLRGIADLVIGCVIPGDHSITILVVEEPTL